MRGGVRTAGWVSILAAGGLALGSAAAQAADLGGDCCADLEERIAELEATTARKGNRKVSLTVSGWVNEAVFFWDDGTEKNVYVGTNKLEQSRFKFAGEAKIDKEWSAGYTIEVGIVNADSGSWDQVDPGRNNGVFTLRKSNWWIKSKQYGKLTIGQEGTSTYHLLDDADGAVLQKDRRMLGRERMELLLVRHRHGHQGAVDISRLAARRLVDQRREAAEDHPLAVEGHRGAHLLHAGIAHDLLIGRIAGRPVGIFEPGEDDLLVGPGVHGLAEIRDLALGNVAVPGLDVTLDPEFVE